MLYSDEEYTVMIKTKEKSQRKGFVEVPLGKWWSDFYLGDSKTNSFI